MSILDITVVAIIIILLILAVYYSYKRRGITCSGSCGGCPFKNNCKS